MISLIVVALVGIGFTRLTMLALELRDNYEDNPSDEPVDLSRKRVDAHNKMVSMAKPEKMLVKGDNRYEPKADGSFSKGDGESSYSAMLASTEATLQAGFDALFSYGQAESVEPPEESAAVAADEAVKDIGEESDASATQPVSKPAKIADLEAAQSAVDPTVRLSPSFAPRPVDRTCAPFASRRQKTPSFSAAATAASATTARSTSTSPAATARSADTRSGRSSPSASRTSALTPQGTALSLSLGHDSRSSSELLPHRRDRPPDSPAS